MKTINLKSILTLFFLAGHFVVLLSQPTGLGTQNAIQPFYIGEDQGAFYFAREGNKIRFVGENPVADYCIVFWGKQENDKISGKWWSLPKYGQSSRGTLEAKLIKDNEIVITEETGGFPTTALRPSVLNANIQRQLTYEKLPKWPNRIVNYNNSLSGAFKAEGKKIVCYTRQVGNFVRMYCESEASGSNKPSFSYLFLGQREGNRVDGKVYGLPKGKQSGVANATFFVQGESTLSSSSSFKLGSDTWKRKIPDFGKQIDEYVNSKPNNEGFLEPYASPGTFNIGSNQTSQGAKFCEEREWDYKKNIKSNTVLELTDLFPGQLIKINRALKEGNPQTIDQLARAPLTYTVSGNGLHFEGGGAFTVKDVKRSNYATKLQRKLNNQIRKNEYQPIQGEAETYSYWTKKQFLMDIGVNYSSLSASVLNNSGFEKDENNYIFSAFVRNAYYKVTVDEIEKPSDLFTPEVTLSMVENVHTSPNVRLGYVSSVTYGALMLLSFKVENNNSFVDIESAFKAIAGGGLVSGDVRTKYNELLQNVEISYKLLGGQWEPFSHTNDINEIIKEYNEINKRISTGSTVRNGVPIAYEVKYVKNNNSAAVGQATKYKETKCKIVDDYISHETAGLFTAVYRVTAGDGTVVYDKKFKRDEGRKIKVDLPLSLPDPLTLEINLRSILKPLSAKGGWSFFWEGQITRGCHYRMGGSSINQADLVIQECDEN